MHILNYIKSHFDGTNFGTSRRSEGIDILASEAYGYYKSKSKTRNFWDKGCFLLIDDSWDHNSDSELFEESFQLKNEIIPFFKKDVIGEYAFINSDKRSEMDYLKFPWWPPKNKIEIKKLNEQFKYIKYVLEKGYFAEGHLNDGFKLMTVTFIVSEIDWSLITNIPEDIILIYDDREIQTNFPESDRRIKISFQDIRTNNS